MSEEKEYTAYFNGTLSIKAKSIEEAWKKWEIEEAKIEDIDIDDIDIY